MLEGYLALFASIAAAAFAHIILKKGTLRYRSGFQIVLNSYVLIGYFLMIISLIFNVWGFTKVSLKSMCFILPFLFPFVTLLARYIFKEKLTLNFGFGMLLIIIGVTLFNLRIF